MIMRKEIALGDGPISANKCFIIAQKKKKNPCQASAACEMQMGERGADERDLCSMSLQMMWEQRRRPGCG